MLDLRCHEGVHAAMPVLSVRGVGEAVCCRQNHGSLLGTLVLVVAVGMGVEMGVSFEEAEVKQSQLYSVGKKVFLKETGERQFPEAQGRMEVCSWEVQGKRHLVNRVAGSGKCLKTGKGNKHPLTLGS